MAKRHWMAILLLASASSIHMIGIACDETDQPVRSQFPTGVFTFADSEAYAGEAAGSISFSVRRADGHDEAGVWVVARELTAGDPEDFHFDSLQIQFAPGMSETTLTIPVAQDTLREPEEIFLLLLREPYPGSRLGDSDSMYVWIMDDDSASAAGGYFMFVTDSLSVTEGEEQVAVQVRRGRRTGDARVWVETADQTARAGTDYERLSRQLEFADGDTLLEATIALRADTYPEREEAFSIRLRDTSAGWRIERPCSMIVSILDDDICCPRDSIYFPMDVGAFWRYRRSSWFASEGYESSGEDTAAVRVLGTVSHGGRVYAQFGWDRPVGHTSFLFEGHGPIFAMMVYDTLIAESDSVGWKRHATYPWKLFDENAPIDSTVTFFEYEDPTWDLVQRYAVAYRGTRLISVPAGSYESAQVFEYKAYVSYCGTWTSVVEEYSVVSGIGLVRIHQYGSGVGWAESYHYARTFDLISCYAGP